MKNIIKIDAIIFDEVETSGSKWPLHSKLVNVSYKYNGKNYYSENKCFCYNYLTRGNFLRVWINTNNCKKVYSSIISAFFCSVLNIK